MHNYNQTKLELDLLMAQEEIVELKRALAYVAFAMHGTRQHMLAPGITLSDNDRVIVKVSNVHVDTGRVDVPWYD